MLYIVLALVVAAFGLLIAALTTANTLWAWLSVVVSVVAAALLVMDWVSGRRRSKAGKPAKPSVVTVGGARRPHDEPAGRVAVDERPPGRRHDRDDEADGPDAFDDTFDNAFDGGPPAGTRGDLEDTFAGTIDREVRTEEPRRDAPRDRPPEREPADAESSPGAGEDERTGIMAPVAPPEAEEPDEEPTDASDLLVVAGLAAEVRVVDEHPRYHLPTCLWLANRPTIPIAVSEARQLGFTPCARCGPDAVLAARHRAAR